MKLRSLIDLTSRLCAMPASSHWVSAADREKLPCIRRTTWTRQLHAAKRAEDSQSIDRLMDKR